MRLVSLNVATPEVIDYRGQEILTGIRKRSVEDALMVRRRNIDGDAQADLAVHGGIDKAVYAFPAEHYDYYRAELGADEYPPGQFGENLTTEGLRETGVHIGDRFRIGDALLEVSQPRSPCYKFAIRMGDVEALRLCVDSARTGFYLRVLEEGEIRAGDEIGHEFRDASAPTVDAIHRLYYLDKRNRRGLRQAVSCDRLAASFRDAFVERLEKLEGRK